MPVEAHQVDHRIEEAKRSGKLDLSDLRLTEVPPQVADLDLTELRLDGNQFIELPTWLGDLPNLTKLSLDNCRLTAVPDQIASLTGLTELSLDNNWLTELPGWL